MTDIVNVVLKNIKRVNEKHKDIEKIARIIVENEFYLKERDIEKVVAVLKGIAICKLANISEYVFSKLIKEDPSILEELGYKNKQIKNFYYALKYSPIWRYRKYIYELFGIKEREKKTIICPYCGSKDIIKRGKRKVKSGKKQRYYCKACNRGFVLERNKEFIIYDKKWRNIAGNLYCDVMKNMSVEDIVEEMNERYGLNITKNIVITWINRYIRENINELQNHQKNYIIVKKIIELDENGLDEVNSIEELRNLFKIEWGYRITYVRVFKLVRAVRKLKENDDTVKKMINEGMNIGWISRYLDIPKDMVRVMYKEYLWKEGD